MLATIRSSLLPGRASPARQPWPRGFSSFDSVSLETIDQRRFAREDPRGFLTQFRGPVIIDEVQHAPDLLYFHDTGLLCQLLGIRDAGQIVSHPLRGAIFENHVVTEVVKSYLHHHRTPPLFFWRDRTGHEIDLLNDHIRSTDAFTRNDVAVRPWFAI